MYKKLLVTLFLVFNFAVISDSAVLFEMAHKEFNPESTAITNILVDGKLVKMEHMEDGKKLDSTMIFLGNTDEMIFVDHQEKKYFSLNKKDMQKISDQMSQAMAQLDEALKEMPPAQREQMKKMMKDKMPGMGNTEYVKPVIKMSGNETVKGYSCTNYDIYKGNKLYRKSCVTKWKNIEGGDQIAAAMINMTEFMEEMTKSFSNNSQVKFEKNVFHQLKEMDGFPIKTIDYGDNDKIDSESIFESSKIVNATQSDFKPPAGYKKEVISM